MLEKTMNKRHKKLILEYLLGIIMIQKYNSNIKYIELVFYGKKHLKKATGLALINPNEGCLLIKNSHSAKRPRFAVIFCRL